MSGHRTAGHRTAGHLDPDGWVDTDVVDADGDGRHGRHPGIPTTATTPLPLGCRPEVLPGRRHLGDQQPGQLSRRDTAKGLATAATRQLQGDIPPFSQRLGALLSSDDFGSRVERTAKLHPLWRANETVAA